MSSIKAYRYPLLIVTLAIVPLICVLGSTFGTVIIESVVFQCPDISFPIREPCYINDVDITPTLTVIDQILLNASVFAVCASPLSLIATLGAGIWAWRIRKQLLAEEEAIDYFEHKALKKDSDA